MAFAGNSVAIYPAAAVQGDRANQNPTIYTAHNWIAATPVTVGAFVWRDTGNPETAVAAGGTYDPLGIVERTHEYTAESVPFNGSLVIPAKNNVSVIEKGQVWLTADTTVTVGMKAFASLTDGTVKFDAAGSEVEGYVETTFEAVTAGTVGEVVIVDNHMNAVSAKYSG